MDPLQHVVAAMLAQRAQRAAVDPPEPDPRPAPAGRRAARRTSVPRRFRPRYRLRRARPAR